MVDITLPIAFAAGILTFLSPCILPLVPAYISYLAGSNIGPGKAEPSRGKIFLSALMFVLGFSLVFSLLGILLASILQSVAFDARILLTVEGGLIIVGFGIYLLLTNLGKKKSMWYALSAVFAGNLIYGLISFSGFILNLAPETSLVLALIGAAGLIGSLTPLFLKRETNIPSFQGKLKPRRFKNNYLTSFIFGVAFAAGWTPCIGAVLGGILTLAITVPEIAFNLMLAFSIGIGVPFLIAGALISQFSVFISKFARFMKYFSVVMAVVLIAIGVLVVAGYIGSLSSFIPAELAAFESMALG